MTYFVIPAFTGIQVIPEKPETLDGHRSLSRTRCGVGRDPWFDRPFDKLTVLRKVEGLTVLGEVEGESRKIAENQIILDLPTPLAGDDKSPYSLSRGRGIE